ncbi:MAG: response regulator, partial [Bacteroidia bacterium]|nr:response regulator [Bacteroidia bacterium]
MINKVAIVDDDNIFQFTTKIKIEKLLLAKEVMVFNDGEEIYNYLNDSDVADLPDVLLLDINMP